MNLKRNLSLYFLLILIFTGKHFLFAQIEDPAWKPVLGGWGQQNNIFVTSSGLLYSNSGNKLYKSMDTAQHWVPLSIPKYDEEYFFNSIQVGHAGTFFGVKYVNSEPVINFISKDEGLTWESISDSLVFRAILEISDGTMVAITDSGAFRSANKGLTWEKIQEIKINGFNDNLDYMQSGDILVRAANRDYYLSSDGGLNWRKTHIDDYYERGTFWHTPSGLIFHGPYSTTDSLDRSSDGGITYTRVLVNNDLLGGSGVAGRELIELPSGKLLYFHAHRGRFVSDDGGITWAKMQYHFPNWEVENGIPKVLPNGGILLKSEMDGEYYTSFDEGLNWVSTNEGIRGGGKRYEYSEDSIYCLTKQLLRSFNGGVNWARISAKPNLFVKKMDFLNYRDTILLVQGGYFTFDEYKEKIFLSTDKGQSFQEVPFSYLLNSNTQTLKNIYRNKYNKTVYFNLGTTLAKSMDYGQSWQFINVSAFIDNGEYIKQMEFHPSGEIFLLITSTESGNAKNKLIVSSDGGNNWSLLQSNIGQYGSYLVIDSYSGKIYFYNQRHLSISNDLGATWITRSLGFINTTYNVYTNPGKLAIDSLGNIFILGGDATVYLSKDEGVSWRKFKFGPYSFLDLYTTETGKIYYSNYWQIFQYVSQEQQSGVISGSINKDYDGDCSTYDPTYGNQQWLVNASGAEDYFTSTDSSGRYSLTVDTGAYAVKVTPPNNVWWTLCANDQPADIVSPSFADTIQFDAVALANCPLIAVEVTIPRLRRCFENTFLVKACNYGVETTDSAFVDVRLDPYLSMTGISSVPYVHIGDSVYRFQLGTLQSGDCIQFDCQVYLNCDSTILGQTHCISAHGFPDTLCRTVPGWSGATLKANVNCEDSLVKLNIKNIGNQASQPLEYIIIEDDVVLMSGQKSYLPGDSINFSFSPNGRTWRIQSDQEPNHPFSNQALAFTEGCGGFGSLGFINQFPVDPFLVSNDQECVPNGGSFDPNDKQGFPTGLGIDKIIRNGQLLEYRIRFQNTGSDTAFTVVIRDTLSEALDPSTIEVGSASHPYIWNINGKVLTFQFNNIMLPDSNVNEPGSHGFIRFKINQKADLTPGSVIENSAAIYFDFNDPVITNITSHTIGAYTVNVKAPGNSLSNSIAISPNPAAYEVEIRLHQGEFEHHTIMVSDMLGRTLKQVKANGGATFRLGLNDLSQGVYLVKVYQSNGALEGRSVIQLAKGR